MTYEHRDGSGALFPNDKQGNDRRPDWRGDVMIEGKKWRLSGWVKDGRNGEFISLKSEPDEAREEAPRQPQRSAAPSARPRPKDEAYQAAGRGTGRFNDRGPREDDEADIPF